MLTSYFSAALAIVLTVVVSLGILLWVRKKAPHKVWAPHNDAIGFVYSAIAVLYAVILGFSLIAMWESYDQAEGTTHQEANALVGLYELSRAFSPEDQAAIRPMLTSYATTVIENEWPAMQRNEAPEATAFQKMQDIWVWYTAKDAESMPNPTAYEASIDRLIDLQIARRDRIYESQTGINPYMLMVLVIGAIPTILGPVILGVENRRVHTIIIGGIAGTVSFIVLAAFMMNHPFQGDVSIGHEALDLYLRSFT